MYNKQLVKPVENYIDITNTFLVCNLFRQIEVFVKGYFRKCQIGFRHTRSAANLQLQRGQVLSYKYHCLS